MTLIYHLLPGQGSWGRAWRAPQAALVLLLSALGAGPGGAALADEVFRDVTEKAGIHFQHVNGAAGNKHLFEAMIGGAGWFDFDGDDLLDLFVVQGHDDPGRAFEPGTQSDVLYRNRGDGTFED